MPSISIFSEIQRCPLVIRMTDDPFDEYGAMARVPGEQALYHKGEAKCKNVSLLLM
jgi:hypothetical protein